MTDFYKYVRSIPNFPHPENLYRDLTPLFQDPIAFQHLTDILRDKYRRKKIDKIIGIDTIGTTIGSALAYSIGAGFVPFLKNAVFPTGSSNTHFTTEFSTGILSVYPDSVRIGERILIQGSVLATGATSAAAVRLADSIGGIVTGLSFIAELTYLAGRKQLLPYNVDALLTFRDQKPYF